MASQLPSGKERIVLRLLRDGAPAGMYGLEIVGASGGEIGRGGVYVMLARMEDKGFVKMVAPAQGVHPGLPRPRYKLTALGQCVLDAVQAAADTMGHRWAGA